MTAQQIAPVGAAREGVPARGRAAPVRLAASTPAQLVATLPYLFGFVPAESVIVLALTGKRVTAAGRLDAGAVIKGADLAQPLRAVTQHGHPMIVVAWMDDEEAAASAAAAVSFAIGGAAQTIVVSRGRCRAGGGPWEPCAGELPEAGRAGLTVLPDRASVAAQVAGPSPRDRAAVRRWAGVCARVGHAGLPWRQHQARALLRRGVRDPDALSVDELVQLAALVRDGAVRDVIWPGLTRERAGAHLCVWRRVVPLVPDDGAPAVLGLLAMSAWLTGDGVLPVCCLQRGLRIDAGHSLLRLVSTINALGMHPDAWEGLRRGLAVGHGGTSAASTTMDGCVTTMTP